MPWPTNSDLEKFTAAPFCDDVQSCFDQAARAVVMADPTCLACGSIDVPRFVRPPYAVAMAGCPHILLASVQAPVSVSSALLVCVHKVSP